MSTLHNQPALPERRKPPLPPPYKATSAPSNKTAEQDSAQQDFSMSGKKGTPPPRPPPRRPKLAQSHCLDIQNIPTRPPPPPPPTAARNKLSGSKSLDIQELRATRPAPVNVNRTNSLSPRKPVRPPPVAPAPTIQTEQGSVFMETMASLHDCSISEEDRPNRLAPVSPIRAPAEAEHDNSDIGMREALCPFTADAVYELSLEEGESLMEMEPPDDLGWCLGIKDDGSQGYYPSSYVKPIGLFQ